MDYCIPLKDANLVEIIRGAVLWNIWLDRNRILFNAGHVYTVQVLGAKIMALANFWATNQKSNLTSQLNLILPSDLKDLIGSTMVSMEAIQDLTHMHGLGITLMDDVSDSSSSISSDNL